MKAELTYWSRCFHCYFRERRVRPKTNRRHRAAAVVSEQQSTHGEYLSHGFAALAAFAGDGVSLCAPAVVSQVFPVPT